MSHYQEDFAAIFKMANKNANGTLTLEELSSQMRAFGYRNIDKPLEIYFSRLGADRYGISLEQFLGSMDCAPHQLHRAAYLRRVFREYDKDGNGKLDRREFHDICSKLGERLTKEETEVVMMVLDKNLNSYIDLEEFISAINHKAVN
ncbi:hypothetical protein HELRODRAFT_163490 [Helobdella robusta]|uniref:EF-hand domain-containing protein n=1 Tax=Helobdella robusta TaxID=6412 RepID=T1EU45_HELRO|nr:hypothetical protein HELRODRAFT_163490 [Helobdella robusta]ESN96430.1 hypothetical protein HELRODRAFT_163490 [Helobdella robusta]